LDERKKDNEKRKKNRKQKKGYFYSKKLHGEEISGTSLMDLWHLNFYCQIKKYGWLKFSRDTKNGIPIYYHIKQVSIMVCWFCHITVVNLF
jgi:hypothetical protein